MIMKYIFTPTLNHTIYLYKKIMDGETTTANVVMRDVGLLEYSYETSQSELKALYKNQYKNGLREFRVFKWIKTYPTQIAIQSNEKKFRNRICNL